jgi:glycosyltransferase involved in cell wall biosynthesis
VRVALAPLLPDRPIEVIGHGVSGNLPALSLVPSTRRPAPGEAVSLLTAGGWAPHKRQHLVPQVGRLLADSGLAFTWTVAGPAGRVPGYREAVEADVQAASLSRSIRTLGAVSDNELARLYDRAHLYVQPSTEEGFCLTALDAAAAGLPVIGSPAGALPEICASSGGILVPSEPEAISRAILRFVHGDLWPPDPLGRAAQVRSDYSWAAAADRLADLYAGAAGAVASVA